jgi:uncharacterized protein (TIGR00266 family)
MQVEIVQGPGSSAAKVFLTSGETCVAEGGALIAYKGNVEVQTATHDRKRGIMRGLKRLVGGESFFQNYFTATGGQAEVMFSATLPGDMLKLEVGAVGIVAEGGSFVVRSTGVEMDLGWQGLKSMFSGEGLFWLKLKGNGTVVLNSFGAIYAIDVDGEYVVDTGHIVAFEETLNFSISKAGKSWISSFLGGEGLACRFKGKGRIWCQSHNAQAFGSLVGPMLRPR